MYVADEGIGRMSWQRVQDSTFGNFAIRASAFGNGAFVIGGDGGRLARSANGRSWTRVDVCEAGIALFGDSGVLGIVFGAGIFVAAGHDGKMAWSVDGTAWERLHIAGFGPNEQISGVATDGRGRFVAVGNCYANDIGRIVSWYQLPGIVGPPPGGTPPGNGRPQIPEFIPVERWLSTAVPYMGDSGIRGIAWNGHTYVAVGDGAMVSSVDGRSWTEILGIWNFADTRVHFRDVVWGADGFVAVGYWAVLQEGAWRPRRPFPGGEGIPGLNTGVIAVSDSYGANWAVLPAPVLRQLIGPGVSLVVDPKVYAVAYAGGYHVAVGERGWSARSSDAVNWEPVWISPFSVYGQNDINQSATSIATDGAVFLVGGTMGRLASSSNLGRSWNWIANGLLDGEFNDILTLAYGNGRFVAAGADGRMRFAASGHIGVAAGWIPTFSQLHNNINAIVWGGGSFVAVGDFGGLVVSDDGSRWSVVSPPGVGSGNIYSVTVGNRFVAGGRGQIIYSD